MSVIIDHYITLLIIFFYYIIFLIYLMQKRIKINGAIKQLKQKQFEVQSLRESNLNNLYRIDDQIIRSILNDRLFEQFRY